METDTTRGAERHTAATSEIISGLNDLLQLDHDAIGAYTIAIEKLEDQDLAQQIRGFRMDHERHVRNLNELITGLGGTPQNEPHATGPLKEALQSLGAMAGDKGVLLSFRANELQVRSKYDGYAAKANAWPAHVKRVVDENALDEERHYGWVATTLERMGVAPGEGAETHLMNRMREGTASTGGKLQQTTDQVRDRVGDVVDNVRNRASDMADDVRERATGMTDNVRERAGEMAGNVRGRAGEVAGSTRNRIAGALESAAHTLDDTATQRTAGATGAKAKAGTAAHRVAGGLESTAGFVRSGDVDQLRNDLEARVQQSPVKTLLIAMAAGFVVGRILR